MKRFLLSLAVLALAGHAAAQAATVVSDAPSLLRAIAAASATPSVVMVQPGEYVGKVYGQPGTKAVVNVAVPNGVQLTLLAAHGGGTGGGPPPPPPPPPPTSCPYATDGGFSGANTASLYQIANFYTYVTSTSAGNIGTGQTWTSSHPQTNCVPMDDYPIGPYTPIASMADPATVNWSGTGCTYHPTGNTDGGPQLSCALTAPLTISATNFGAVGGHGATQIYKRTAAVGNDLHLLNDHLMNDDVAEYGNGGTIAGYLFRDDSFSDTYVEFSEVDGNNRASTVSNPSGDFKTDAGPNGCSAAGPNRHIIVRYTYWHDSVNRPMNSCAFVQPDIKYSAFVGYALAEGRTGIHGEIWQGAAGAGTSGTVTAGDFDYNLVIDPNTAPPPAGVFSVYLHTGQSNTLALVSFEEIGNTFIAECNLVAAVCGSPGGTASSMMLTLGYASIGTLTVTGNFVDAIGALNCLTNPSSTVITTFVNTGNVDLETGAAIGSFAPGAGHGQACPPLFSS